jgi:hypothetical protein
MWQEMLQFFVYFFSHCSIWGIALALIFGAAWLACYRPPLMRKPWLWAVLAVGAALAPITIAILSFPLRYAVSTAYGQFWTAETLSRWALLASLPSMYLFGLVREGFKQLPLVFAWWRKGRQISPSLGLATGAMCGTGFGIMEAIWTHNYIFSTGWSWENVQLHGIGQLVGFWESFFLFGANLASTALIGWGIGKGRWWQFYLLAANVYLVINYNYVLVRKELLNATQAEFIIAACVLLATGVVLWLREKSAEKEFESV